MKILITGFEPFAEHRSNPSALAVAALSDIEHPEGVTVIGGCLPVEYARIESVLVDLLDRHRPDAVVLTGLSKRVGRLNVERVALNLEDCDAADNAGELRRGGPIRADAPAAYVSRLDLEQLVSVFGDHALPAGISNHAGAFLCNGAYFIASHWAATRRTGMPAVFVHVPPMEDGAFARLDGRPATAPDLARAFVAVGVALAGSRAVAAA